MRRKFKGMLAVAALLVGGSGAAPSFGDEPKTDPAAPKVAYRPASDLGNGHLVWIEKVGDSWTYKKAREFGGNTVPLDGITDAPNQEVLYVSGDFTQVQPYYGSWKLDPMKFFDCPAQRDEGYSPCNSSFTTTSVGATVFKTLFGAGSHAITEKRIDEALVLAAVNAIPLREKLDEYDAQRPHRKYLEAFSQLSGPDSIKKFIDTYSGNDPDLLVPKAKQALEVALQQQAERRNAAAAAQRQREAAAETLQQMQDQVATDARARVNALIARLTQSGMLGYVPKKINDRLMGNIIDEALQCRTPLYKLRAAPLEERAKCGQMARERSLLSDGAEVSAQLTPLAAEWYFTYWSQKLGMN